MLSNFWRFSIIFYPHFFLFLDTQKKLKNVSNIVHMAKFQIVAARHIYKPYPVPKLERSNIFLPPFRGWVFLKIDGHPPPKFWCKGGFVVIHLFGISEGPSCPNGVNVQWFWHPHSISATTYQKIVFFIYLNYFVQPIPLTQEYVDMIYLYMNCKKG